MHKATNLLYEEKIKICSAIVRSSIESIAIVHIYVAS